jgi:DNA-binding protein H-NS
MTLKLNEMSRKDLEKLAAEVQKALKAVEAAEKKMALEAAKKAAAEYGFSLSEITQTTGRTAASAKAKRPPKYFNPKDKSQTWSGSGRQPFWFKDALKAGTDPSKMEI